MPNFTLPKQVNLITFKWFSPESLLLRFENVYQKTESPQSVSFELTVFFIYL